jgi:hypothetical protein
MISASVPESEAVLKLIISKDADVNLKSRTPICAPYLILQLTVPRRLYWPGKASKPSSLSHFAKDLMHVEFVQTALHFVASKKNLDIARILIDNGASTRVRDQRGQYPIHRAAAVGSVPMVTLLLKNRSPLNPTDNEGYTPLHHAIAEGHGKLKPHCYPRHKATSHKTLQEILQSPFSRKVQTLPSRTAQTSWPWILLLTKKYVRNKVFQAFLPIIYQNPHLTSCQQVRRYILQGAEREGIEMSG